MRTFSSSLVRSGAAVLALSFILSPFSAFAASSSSTSSSTSKLEVTGWIPYWRTDAGTSGAVAHINQFTEVNPFGYTVRSDGSLYDAMNLSQAGWQNLIKSAHKNDVRVIPTVMWSDTNTIFSVLSNPTTRAAHIQSIVNAVNQNGFDGIDIDYEGKSAETRDAFSSFLQELNVALKKGNDPKWLQCTIEAREPLAARYSGTPPANIEYSNDLPKINQVCDRVRLMTYDQQDADIQLNNAHAKELYAPVSDAAWVEKVVKYMSTDITKSKMLIGVPTYGAIYEVIPDTDGSGYTYIKTEAFNPQYGIDTAKQYGITPERGASGELGFTYVSKDTPSSLPSQDQLSRLAPKQTPTAWLAAAGALAMAKSEGRQAPLTYLTWSDSTAIQQKVALAQKLGVAGISIFKIDGGMDPDMWSVLPASALKDVNAPKSSVSASGSGSTSTTTATTTGSTTSTGTTSGTTASGGTASGLSTKFTADLQFGNKNSDVLRLQKILVAKGYLKATPNSNFGPATKAAVIAWQKANGVSATGYFGPLSRAKMAAGK